MVLMPNFELDGGGWVGGVRIVREIGWSGIRGTEFVAGEMGELIWGA